MDGRRWRTLWIKGGVRDVGTVMPGQARLDAPGVLRPDLSGRGGSSEGPSSGAGARPLHAGNVQAALRDAFTSRWTRSASWRTLMIPNRLSAVGLPLGPSIR